jgi:hypothetical protein
MIYLIIKYIIILLPQIDLILVMSRRQTIPPPTSIKCCACGKEVDRKAIIRMYEFECCSNECINPLRIKRQAEQDAKEEDRKSKRLTNGVYNMGGGGYAF